MMACKEFDKEFLVFDRPNPVGGIEVEGNILDLNFRSFVGYYPLTQRYGLTLGELAMMFNKEFEIGCKLHIVQMKDWKREYHYQDLNRHWIMPSPNIPTTDTLYTYLTTCYFEGTNVSEGRGTTKPFSVFGAPWMNSEKLLIELKKTNLLNTIPAGIVITGGGAKTAGMERMAKAILKLPVKIGYPKGVDGMVEEISDPEYAASVGLLIYAAKKIHSQSDLSSYKINDNLNTIINKIKKWIS
jgi:hypothetical protein